SQGDCPAHRMASSPQSEKEYAPVGRGQDAGFAEGSRFGRRSGRTQRRRWSMKFFILTDIEGVAGVDSFSMTRTQDEAAKGPAMTQLAKEVNACIEGIKSVYPDADVDVWDGHGSGGLRPEDLVGGRYLREGRPYFQLEGYAAMLFVGQHAMAGTAFAPLCHTYSSRTVAYYRLNGIFVGEFGARALAAGRQ